MNKIFVLLGGLLLTINTFAANLQNTVLVSVRPDKPYVFNYDATIGNQVVAKAPWFQVTIVVRNLTNSKITISRTDFYITDQDTGVNKNVSIPLAADLVIPAGLSQIFTATADNLISETVRFRYMVKGQLVGTQTKDEDVAPFTSDFNFTTQEF